MGRFDDYDAYSASRVGIGTTFATFRGTQNFTSLDKAVATRIERGDLVIS